MSDFVVLADSSCDLPADLRERFGVTDYCPGTVTFPDGHVENADLDWKSISPEDFYGSMNKKNIYRTAFPSLGVQVEFFEKYLKEGKDILCLCLSSGISGTYGGCVSAANELKDKYPNQKIVVIDTLRYSGGIAMILIKIDEMKKAGKSLDEIATWVEENKLCVHQMGTVDDLFFLKAMGRVSGMAALMGSLINIKPLAETNCKGENEVMTKVKGYNALYDATVKYIEKMGKDLSNQTIVISYTNRKPQALQLKELVENAFHPKEILMLVVGQSCGSSIGPGMANVFFWGDPVTEGLVEERKVVEEILGK